ncbi:MAG: hypothetical protein GQE15_17540 [Archangiaceae bacterium]|nr:hypothetical protein [Archangiaceae bacterium]
MFRLLVPLFVVTAACTPLDQAFISVSALDDGIAVGLPTTDPCSSLQPGATATVNGQAATITEMGGGECHDAPAGASLVTLWPSKPGATMRVCNCRQPKVAYVEDTPKPLDVSVCEGARCIRASWPAVPPPRRLIAPERASGTFRVTLDPPTHTMSVSVRQGSAEPKLVRAQGYLDITPIDSRPVVVSLLENTEVSASSCAAASCGTRSLLQESRITVLIDP